MPPTFAVVLRTYAWDPFIARQVGRYREACAGGDFFLSVDETGGPIGPIPHEHVLRTTNEGLLALRLANRFEKGSLVWWNNDYPQYAFHARHPGYDYYVFVEYDSLVTAPLAPMVGKIAAGAIDFVAAPIAAPLEKWFWWLHARQTYGAQELRASLNCICILSNRAVRMLFERRLAMAADPGVSRWPISEAFVATEIARAGYRFAPLSDFGDDSAYRWFPPILEDDFESLTATFVHPLLDQPRYLRSVLRYGENWRDYFDRTSSTRQRLGRLPPERYTPLLAQASWQRFRTMKQEQFERGLLYARLAMQRGRSLFAR